MPHAPLPGQPPDLGDNAERGLPTRLIDIQNAVVSYREDIALRGVSLRVESGEFVGIIGPNGAGKTTLLTIINALGKLLSGRVWVLGQYLTSGNGHSLRKKVGYVPQVENIDPRMPMNVREVVMIGRYGVLGLFRRPDRHDSLTSIVQDDAHSALTVQRSTRCFGIHTVLLHRAGKGSCH